MYDDLAAIAYSTVKLTYHPVLFRRTPGKANGYHSYAIHITGFTSLVDARNYVSTNHREFRKKEELIYWQGSYPTTFEIDVDTGT